MTWRLALWCGHTWVLPLQQRFRALTAAAKAARRCTGTLTAEHVFPLQCEWHHSTPKERGGTGENLYYCRGCKPGEVATRSVAVWYAENGNYDYATGQPRWDKAGSMIGHFTQRESWNTAQQLRGAALVDNSTCGGQRVSGPILYCHCANPLPTRNTHAHSGVARDQIHRLCRSFLSAAGRHP